MNYQIFGSFSFLTENDRNFIGMENFRKVLRKMTRTLILRICHRVKKAHTSWCKFFQTQGPLDLLSSEYENFSVRRVTTRRLLWTAGSFWPQENGATLNDCKGIDRKKQMQPSQETQGAIIYEFKCSFCDMDIIRNSCSLNLCLGAVPKLTEGEEHGPRGLEHSLLLPNGCSRRSPAVFSWPKPDKHVFHMPFCRGKTMHARKVRFR